MKVADQPSVLDVNLVYLDMQSTASSDDIHINRKVKINRVQDDLRRSVTLKNLTYYVLYLITLIFR
jgi:hypothetical protein